LRFDLYSGCLGSVNLCSEFRIIAQFDNELVFDLFRPTFLFAVLFFFISGSSMSEDDKSRDDDISAEVKAKSKASIPVSLAEARGRARWIYELMHGSLQVMHRDFFGDGDDEPLSLPS